MEFKMNPHSSKTMDDEIEKGVYNGTSVYYPELEEYCDDGNKPSDE